MHTLNDIEIENRTSQLNYEILTTHVDDSEQMSYTTYGICVRDESGSVVMNYTDIATSREYVQEFIDMVCERDVSPLHIEDILEDYLD